MYQAKSAKLNIGERGKVGLFFFFRFSVFTFHFSLYFFTIRFRYHFWFFAFHFSYSFFAFRSHFSFFSFFYIQNWAKYRILTFKLRPNIVFLHSKPYFDIRTGAKYGILIFKILF